MISTKEKIIETIKANEKISVDKLAEVLPISKVMIHRHLNKLVKNGRLKRIGIAPKVYYKVEKMDDMSNIGYSLNNRTIKIINANFTLLESNGIETEGIIGFIKWCNDRNYNIKDKAIEYENLFLKNNVLNKTILINASQKLISNFDIENKFLNELYFLYPYNFPNFGKTKMGKYLSYSKQTQNKELIKKVIHTIIPQIKTFIEERAIDSIAFVPPTIPRKLQLMNELKKYLLTDLPIIKIEKIKTTIIMAQKDFEDIKDKIKNIDETIIINLENTEYKKLLLIDDYVDSGSTLNTIAEKIKKQKIANKVIGLAIVGDIN